MQTNRRQFFGAALAGAGATALSVQNTQGQTISTADTPLTADDLIDSPPLLQCPGETGITVVWAVKKFVYGYVQYGTAQDALDQTGYGAVYGQSPFSDQFLQIRISGLKPNTRYYYRTASVPMRVNGAAEFERQGSPVFSEVYSFETAGSGKSSGSFAAINDVHENRVSIRKEIKRIDELAPDYTVFNGDIVNHYDYQRQIVEKILLPSNPAFAAQRPLLYVPGNHEQRGWWNQNAVKIFPAWDRNEPADISRGRNFVLRCGPLAMLALDSGEDKEDGHKQYAGLAHYAQYRQEQSAWLAAALESPQVKTAPFVAAFLHCPFNVKRPFETDDEHDGAWGKLLHQYGVQLVVCGHWHRFNYEAATAERSWAQVVGGGNGPKSANTVIYGKAQGDVLEVAVAELNKNEELGRWKFAKR
ncbi:MAG: metallophosphoesterase [Planctomycetaceae bacterium]|nr:metallophosphoesterase [Planctomycetaceae bacterium]